MARISRREGDSRERQSQGLSHRQGDWRIRSLYKALSSPQCACFVPRRPRLALLRTAHCAFFDQPLCSGVWRTGFLSRSTVTLHIILPLFVSAFIALVSQRACFRPCIDILLIFTIVAHTVFQIIVAQLTSPYDFNTFTHVMPLDSAFVAHEFRALSVDAPRLNTHPAYFHLPVM